MKMNREMQTAGGVFAGITLKARIMGVKARGLDRLLAFINLKEVKK